MKYLTYTTAWPHGLEVGDILSPPHPRIVVAASPMSVTVRYLRWYERLWLWLSGLVQFRGFWARVWRYR